MVACHEFVPQRHLLSVGDAGQLQGEQAAEGLRKGGLRSGQQGLLAGSLSAPLGGQAQDAERFQSLQQVQGPLHARLALRGLPAEGSAEEVAQFGATELGQRPHHLLNVGGLPTPQAVAEAGGELEFGDQEVQHELVPPSGCHSKARKLNSFAKKRASEFQPVGYECRNYPGSRPEFAFFAGLVL